MIDAKTVRNDTEALRQAIVQRKVDPAKADVDRWLTRRA